MSTETMEFNTIKTIKTIQKDGLLQKVYKAKHNSFNYVILITDAKKNTLSSKSIEVMKDIFDEIVKVSDVHSTIYENVNINDATPRRYGKTQINADITEQGGVTSSLQSAMLESAKVKATNATLIDRGTSDRYKGTNKLSEDDLRVIKAASRDYINKISSILKNK
jgi:hypothetical protein